MWTSAPYDNISVGSTCPANNDINPRGFDPPQLQQELTNGLFLHAGEIHNGVDLNSTQPKVRSSLFCADYLLYFVFNRLLRSLMKMVNVNFEILAIEEA